MAGGAGESPGARRHQLLAARNRALGHIGDEAGAWIAQFDAIQIFRHLDDAFADWFTAAFGRHQHIVAGDLGFGDRIGFHHPDPFVEF